MTVTLHELATQARAINAANGWDLDFTFDAVPGYLALIHSEITEAVNELTPEGISRELGDVAVRTLDLMELLQPGALSGAAYGTPGDLRRELLASPRAARFLLLHNRVTAVLERFRKEKTLPERRQAVFENLTALLAVTLTCIGCEGTGEDYPQRVILGILDKNRTRGYRHGWLHT